MSDHARRWGVDEARDVFNPARPDIGHDQQLLGTDSAATIASWIVDGNDNPAIYAVVQFEPFANGPVPTDSTFWGDLKAQFR